MVAEKKPDLSFPGMPALVRAIEALGSQMALARAIDVPHANVYNWLHRDHLVPLAHVPFIVAAAQHYRVTPRSLRPDYDQGWTLLTRQLLPDSVLLNACTSEEIELLKP